MVPGTGFEPVLIALSVYRASTTLTPCFSGTTDPSAVPALYVMTKILLIVVLNTAAKMTKLSIVGKAAPRCHL